MKLSIIVPIYNVEKYLPKCVDSLLNQDIPQEEYEIILVDDGSQDNCGKIADEYAAKFSNIRVIHQENGGLSVARNTGIDAAKGEYIQFVDSDDYLEPNVLGGIVAKIESDGLDVLRFDYQNVNESHKVFQPYKDIKPFVDLRDEICDGLTFLIDRLGYACYAWQFVIRTGLLKDNALFFKPGIYFEDTEWTPRMLICADSVSSTTTIAYNYLLRAGSITRAVDIEKQKKVLEDKISLISSLKSTQNIVPDSQWFDGMISLTTISALELICSSFYEERKSYLAKINEFRIFPLSKHNQTMRRKRKISLANCSTRLFCLIYKLRTK